jgi:Zn-dependent M28 family amino/carboxypeptidase
VIHAAPRRIRDGLALALACSLAFGACQAGPEPSIPVAPSSLAVSSPGPSPSAQPGSSVTEMPLADALRDRIDPEDILADLDRLQSIADGNGGTRAAGTPGHQASANFVAGELRAAGFEVHLDPVDTPVFAQTSPSVLEIATPGAPTFEDVRDYKAMTFSASGDVTAKVFVLGFDRATVPGARTGRGCDAADWAAVPAGTIVLLQPGPCRRHDAVVNAQAAGVAAVITSYAEWPRDAVLRPTLVEPADIHIPVIGTTGPVGLALDDAATSGAAVHLATHTLSEHRTSVNVVAETPGGDPGNVVMLGGHLDSVFDGPGINDNGSGTMTVLEIARELAGLTADQHTALVWKLRVAFWTGEELGLYGSTAYARVLQAPADGPIRAYLNFDMVGSPNGLRVVYDGSATTRPTESAAITNLFKTALDAAGLPWELESIGAASDHFPLDQAGVPIGGLYSGANELKTAEQAGTFGGTADKPMDACYHLACDTRANVDPVLLEQLARAAAWVTGALASGDISLTPS